MKNLLKFLIKYKLNKFKKVTKKSPAKNVDQNKKSPK